MTLGPLFFTAPYMLLALAALPILWILLRAVPPAPIRLRFPAVALLLGLKDEDSSADRTPWWLLLMRMLAVAAVIVGLAGPVLNPEEEAEGGQARLLVVLDASWASAGDWQERMDFLAAQLSEAARAERSVALLRLTRPEAVQFQAAQDVSRELAGISPASWGVANLAAVFAALPEGRFDTLWLSDGLAREGRAEVLGALEARGQVTVSQSSRPLLALRRDAREAEMVRFEVLRLMPASELSVDIIAVGKDPTGQVGVLAREEALFEAGSGTAEALFSLPPELLSRVTRFEISGQRSAGAVVLADDSLSQRSIALVSERENREGLELLSPLHYLEKALSPSAQLQTASLKESLAAKPDVIVMADLADMPLDDERALTEWVEEGGVLVRFAGPRLAASEVGRGQAHPLMPVRLRAGGRFVGGAMSWGKPKALAAFERGSPFYGLEISDELQVSAQVVAQPGPELAQRVIARLTDGTPLVTRKPLGAGNVVLFHISANAEWSNLPLSGLFVRMLERLSVTTSPVLPDEQAMRDTLWTLKFELDAFGGVARDANLPGVDGMKLVEPIIGADLPPGLYEGLERSIALNVISPSYELRPARWPASVQRSDIGGPTEQAFAPYLYLLALLLLAFDIIATLALSGRLQNAAAAALLGVFALAPQAVDAQAEDDRLVDAASEFVLAHVLTGDTRVDEVAAAGLRGLSEALYFRTSVEPAAPHGVDLERDELGLYPLLYWPVSVSQPTLSAEAADKVNAYLRYGGMILFDTRDANVARFGASSPTGQALRRLAAPLNIPELAPIPDDHVLTRTFYLMQDFPGRHLSRDVWAEAAPIDAEQAEGMPFRNLNDGVTPVVIGGNDWASAWAIDDAGRPLLPIGRGFAGERQRELALRFGVNLVMHVLTGNYKSDQVHVPALLERLGQ